MITCTIDLQGKLLDFLKKRNYQNPEDIIAFSKSFLKIDEIDSVKTLIDSFTTKKGELKQYLSNAGIVLEVEQVKVSTGTFTMSNIHSNFTTPAISTLFNTLHVAEQYFEQSSNNLIMSAIYVGNPNEERYPSTNTEINNNINTLKNNLFKTIIDYLIDKNKLNKSDYYEVKKWGEDTVEVFSKNLFGTQGFNKAVYNEQYRKVIDLLEKELLGDSDENAIILQTTGQKIPNLKGNILNPTDRKKFDAYNASIMLLNFDSIISRSFDGVLGVHQATFNSFEAPVDGNKYFKKVKGLITEFWGNDDLSSDGVSQIEDKLTHKLISIIPYYNKKGVATGQFLEMRDIYGLGALLHTFQTRNILALSAIDDWVSLEEDPIKSLQWFLNSISDAYKEGFKGTLVKTDNLPSIKYNQFKYKVGVINSLSNFLKSVEKKEINSPIFSMGRIITQGLVNSMGATYSTYNAGKQSMSMKEMHTHNSERVQLQEGIYTHMKNNSTNLSKFNLTNEQIAEAVNESNGNGTRKLIHSLLGISLTNEAARELEADWIKDATTDEQKLASKVSVFKLIVDQIFPTNRGKEKAFETSLIKEILDNEANIDALNFDEVTSNNEIIAKLAGLAVVQDILDVKLDTMIVRILTTISKQGGEKIPTSLIPSLGQNDVAVLTDRIKVESDPNYTGEYNNYFLNAEHLKGTEFGNNLLGTSIKLEVLNGNEQKDADKLNVIENFASHFEYDFLESFKTDAESVNFMIGNYSDKSRIIDKRINKFAKWAGDYIIGKSPSDKGKILDANGVWNISYEQSNKYYNDLIDKLIKDYSIVAESVPALKALMSKTSKEDILNGIDTWLGSLEYEQFLNIINKIPGVNFSEELHYAKYNVKVGGKTVIRPSINQLLTDYFHIHNSKDLHTAFVENQKESFIHKYLAQNSNSNVLLSKAKINNFNKGKKETNPNVFPGIIESLGYNYLAYEKQFIDEEGNHILYKVQDGITILNPLVDKWLACNEFFRNEYLYMTVKPEYMHPAKKMYRETKVNINDKDFNVNDFLEDFNSESGVRLSGMAKRNVSYTGTTEIPTRKSQYGVPTHVNVAVINDSADDLYNIAGDKKSVDIHDGASWLNYSYSKMIDHSFQGKGYAGTKKQLATFITDFGSALKKDAEHIITNAKIRDSRKSEINFKNKQKQIFNIPITIGEFDSGTLTSDNKMFIDGIYKAISSYTITNNVMTLNLSAYDQISQAWVKTDSKEIPINTLYDVWEAFGAEHSVNDSFTLDEGSNEQLFNLIVNYKEDDVLPLKDKMIHIVSNQSAFKSGATNVHPKSYWTSSEDLKYTTFKNRHMGIQLDAGHDVTNSKMKEVTQLISALAQNPDTAEKAAEMYDALSSIIKRAAEESYKIEDIDQNRLEKIYKELSNDLVSHLSTSTQNKGLASTIAETFEYGKALPFSNQNFFGDFIKNLVTKMNQDFITRYYPGTGAVLAPSHKFIQLFENELGQSFTQSDLADLALNDYTKDKSKYFKEESNGTISFNMTPGEIIDFYVAEHFKDIEGVWADQFQLGDSYRDDQGKIISLNNLDQYYSFKKNFIDKQVTRVYNAPRDLKPIEITFEVNTAQQGEWTPEQIKVFRDTAAAEGRLIKALFKETGLDNLNDAIAELTGKLNDVHTTKVKYKTLAKLQNDIIDLVPKLGISPDMQIGLGEVNELIAEKMNSQHETTPETSRGVKMNLFDFESVRLKFLLPTIFNESTTTHDWHNDGDKEFLKQFAEFTESKDEGTIAKHLGIWTQRNLQLLKRGKTLRSIYEFTDKVTGVINFKEYFGNDKLTSIVFDDYASHYMNDNLSIAVTNYNKKAAELILGNIYKDTFSTGKDTLSKIRLGGNEYFKEKLKDIYTFNEEIKADFKIALGDGEPDVYIQFVPKGKLPTEKVKTLRSITSKEYDKKGDLIRYRLNENGDKLYEIPINAAIESSNKGYDILYIEAGKTITLKKGGEKSYIFEKDKNINNVINGLLRSFDSNIKGIVPIMNNIWEAENTKPIDFNYETLRNFKKYSGFIDNQTTPYDQNFLQNKLPEILDQVSNRTYISWEKSHEFVSARIPAQSMQSFMEMKNVGYFDTDSNEAYVSVWQIFIQGSDFDIDKAYIMGHGFNKAGHYEVANDIFDFKTKQDLDIIEQMPIPSNIEIVESMSGKNIIDISNEFTNFIKTNGLDSFEDFNKFTPETLQLLSTVLTKILKKTNVSLNYNPKEGEIITPEAQIEYDTYKQAFIDLINKYNTSQRYNSKKFAIPNSIVAGIKQIISSPTNQIFANKPVDIDPLFEGAAMASKLKANNINKLSDALLTESGDTELTDATKSIIESIYKVQLINISKLPTVASAIKEAKRIDKLKNTLSAHDVLSFFKQQQDASVGKTDVGIGANGLKVMFALSNYYNEYYKSLYNENEIDNTGTTIEVLKNKDGNTINFHTDPKWFKKTFNMGEPLGVVIKTTIADVNVTQDLIDKIVSNYGLQDLESQLQIILDGEAALHASGIVSGATDNAKELIMSKINAIEDLTSMHMYMIALGFTSQEVAMYMNSPLAEHLVKIINSTNIFGGKFSVFIPSEIKQYIKDNPAQESIANTFLDIYDGSKEFSNLAGILKINQKTSADIESLFLYLNKLNKAMYTREHTVLKDGLISLQTGNKLDESVKKIQEAHPNILSTEYIKDVISRASNIEVEFINNKGLTEKKQVSLVGGQFDVRYYIYPGKTNDKYRQLTIEYYNLFKNTINVFDVLENSSHFKAMIDGLSATHNKSLITSKKYNFVFNTAVDVIREKSSELYLNNKEYGSIKTFLGNSALFIDIKEKEISRLLRGYDGFLIGSWLKQEDTKHFRFNIKELLKQANVESIELFTDNLAKTIAYGKKNPSATKITSESDDFIVDLTTDYGIANFKRIMENLILPTLQSSQKAGLGSMLRLKSVKNPFGIYTSQIVSVFGLSSLDSEVNLAKYQEILNHFNEVDSKIEHEKRITNTDNKIIPYQDLLYMYNLITNNEAYGDNRLTALFQDYMKDSSTVAYKYLNYSREVDLRHIDIFKIDIDPSIKNNNEKDTVYDKLIDSQKNDILFLALQNRGFLNVKRLNDHKMQGIRLENSDFVINTFMDVTENKDIKKYEQFMSLLSLMRDSNLLTHFKCD